MAGRDGSPGSSGLGRNLSRRTSSRSPLRETHRTDGDDRGEDERILLEDLGTQDGVEDAGEGQRRASQGDGLGSQDLGIGSSRDSTDLPARRPSQHRVRFSSDLERGADPTMSRNPGPQSLPVPPSAIARPSRPDLNVDTFVTTSEPGPANPPPGDTSRPKAVSHLSPIPQGAVPVPPRTRHRGYSLRRSLFTKNIGTQSDESSADIELGHASSSDDVGRTGKVDDVEVVVAARPKDDDSTAVSDPTEQLKGTRPYSMTSSHERWLKRRGAQVLISNRVEQFNELFRKHVLRIKEIPRSEDGRHIDLNVRQLEPLVDERTGRHYISNTIRSSRYSIWSFFPRQLVAQFSKLANFYFLTVAILQMIPGLSTTGTFTTFVPLMIFVGISMGKEGFDDFRRYRLDREENSRIAYVLRPHDGEQEGSAAVRNETDSVSSSARDWTAIRWVDIKVGDVIKLERDQAVPADLVLLHADGPNGIAYIETMALDGETNLKSKQPLRPIAKTCETPEDIIQNTSIHFVVEDPNLDLYHFDGNVTVGNDKLPLTNNEIAYRGSVLRNTHEAYGMVIYTGEECKIRMNANKNPRIKAPALQASVNRVVIVIVTFVVVLASACTIAYRFWVRDVEVKSWYLREANVSYGPIFTSFLIMFNTMIPISLYVSLEIVKVAQMLLLNDIDMYDEASDTPLEARTSTINEELGQVSYIFSDKTGTLTNNEMRFRRMSVAGTAWTHDTDLLEEAALEANQEKLLHKKRMSKGKKAEHRKSFASSMRRVSRKSNVSNYQESEYNLALPTSAGPSRSGKMHRGGRTTEMLEYIEQKPHTLFAKKAKFFILALALCHTCLPEQDEDGDISFQAASPDEVALVTAAKEMGYLVIDREPNKLTIRISSSTGPNGEPVDEVYEVLDVIEFSSARKRMSIIVRMPDQRICIFCKGADSAIMKLLKRADLAAEKATEIERRASVRKSMDAKEVMARNSEHTHRRDSKRTSMSIGRSSFAGGRRSSVSGRRHSSLRDSVDIWLRDRETDGGMALRREDDEHYSPRPSAQFGGQQSSVYSDGRVSFQTEDREDLVEESLVVNEALVFERCFQHLNDFATEGLRTLLYGHRFIDEAEYQAWKVRYMEATTSLVDRQRKIEEVGDEVETDFELVGATAIEDKLQKGVPEAIDKLRRANIKLWMLTGDKRETAINIGHSCRLVKDYSTVTILDDDAGDVEQTIISTATSIKRGAIAHSVIVVDGQTLSNIASHPILRDLFFDLAILADSVICCRASPKQKAFLVRCIRKRVHKSITLAIGDGANDIAMIQEAHVGIGITGKEGLQAARISDYSIAQFRFLLKLLLVHGRWNYIRVCKYTLGTFWKETVFYLTQALYQRWNGYTGTSLYEPWALSMFNTLFTSLPVIFLGIFEKDLAASTLLAVPELYNKGQRHAGFNIRLYLGWAFMGTCEAMIIFFVMYGLLGQALITNDNGVFALGLVTYSACVVVINLKLQALEIRNRTVMALVAIVASVGGWWLWNIILSRRNEIDEIYNVRDNFLTRTGTDLLWWTTLLLAIAAVVLFEIAVSAARVTLFPTDVDVFQELEQDMGIKMRFEEAAASELQQGWNRGTKKSSLELAREKEAETREKQVQDLLDRRRRGDDDGEKSRRRRSGGAGKQSAEMEEVELSNSAAAPRRSLDINELFSKGFGTIRKGPELR
ncbi:hypothetical protein AJ80_03092 [Polytolypa hystricis UAMH7299]|uniref:Phospholipid-transporting ATPase n=1 Tax=Polytolypa hystricis (strain UAMH7299) TaxID=1447883 RepID=A0A2B7YKR6_POLH7|nr:hypothetical protein AJ80_03092 [Polytolypa hystricis UAMH7299]